MNELDNIMYKYEKIMYNYLKSLPKKDGVTELLSVVETGRSVFSPRSNGMMAARTIGKLEELGYIEIVERIRSDFCMTESKSSYRILK